MIEVTFKFDSIEKAIATLGSLMKGAAPVPNIENPAKPEGATAGKPRKPRADAGKARGPYKDNGAATSDAAIANNRPANPVTATVEPTTAAPPETAVAPPVLTGANNEVPDSASPESTPSGASAAAATQEQAQAALEALFAAKGLPAAQEAMSRFGVSRLRDMKPEHYGEFVQLATEAAK